MTESERAATSAGDPDARDDPRPPSTSPRPNPPHGPHGPGGMDAIDDDPVRGPDGEDAPGGMTGIPPDEAD